jgi:hypothetical protein
MDDMYVVQVKKFITEKHTDFLNDWFVIVWFHVQVLNAELNVISLWVTV